MQIFKKIIPFYEFDALCNADLEYVKEQRFKNRLKYNATKNVHMYILKYKFNLSNRFLIILYFQYLKCFLKV